MCSNSDSNELNFINKYCKYLNRKVILKTVKSSHIGSLKCIDPLTQTIALVVAGDTTSASDAGDGSNKSKLILAMSHAIRSIELVDDTDDRTGDDDSVSFDLSRLLSPSTYGHNDKTCTDEELKSRKQNVVDWLKKNRIPCEELADGSLCIAYALTLSPPYTRDQCLCGNEMVLRQIQTLLDAMSASDHS